MADFIDNTAPDENSAAGPAGRIRTTNDGIRYPIFDKTISDNYIKARREYELNVQMISNEHSLYEQNLSIIISMFETPQEVIAWYNNPEIKEHVDFALVHFVSLENRIRLEDANYTQQLLLDIWSGIPEQQILEGGKKLRKSKKQSSKKRRTKKRR